MTNEPSDPARRAALLSAAVLLGAGGAGCAAGTQDRGLVFASLDDALLELDRLMQVPVLRSAAAWNWPQTLRHCAQSVEYSMAGFPQAKPVWFQRSVGALAFSAFSWRQRMVHDLAEPIPGAPALGADMDADQAAARLRASITAFRQATQGLRPHFAYGTLDKAEYERAHAMHLANHFSVFDVAA